MHILALLDDEGFRRVRACLPPSLVLQRLSVPEIERELRTGYVGALIVDPCAVRAEVFGSIVSAAAVGGQGMLLYIVQSGVAIERALEASRQLPVEIVISGIDDEQAVIRALLADLMRHSVPAIVLRGLADRLMNVPRTLQRASVSLFGWSALPHSAKALVSTVGAPARTVNRWLARARLRSAGQLLTSAQLARTWNALETGRYSVARVAEIGGIRSVRALTRAFHRVIGMSPRRAPRSMNNEEFARRLITAVQR